MEDHEGQHSSPGETRRPNRTEPANRGGPTGPAGAGGRGERPRTSNQTTEEPDRAAFDALLGSGKITDHFRQTLTQSGTDLNEPTAQGFLRAWENLEQVRDSRREEDIPLNGDAVRASFKTLHETVGYTREDLLTVGEKMFPNDREALISLLPEQMSNKDAEAMIKQVMETGDVVSFIRENSKAAGMDLEDPQMKEGLAVWEDLQRARDNRNNQEPLDMATIKTSAQKLLEQGVPPEELLMTLEMMFPNDKAAIASLLPEKNDQDNQGAVSGEMDPAPVKALQAELTETIHKAHQLQQELEDPTTPPDEKKIEEANALATGIFDIMGRIWNFELFSIDKKLPIPGKKKPIPIKLNFKPIKHTLLALGFLSLVTAIALLGITAKTTGRFAKR